MITNFIFGDELLVKLSQGSQLLSILERLEGSEGGILNRRWTRKIINGLYKFKERCRAKNVMWVST